MYHFWQHVRLLAIRRLHFLTARVNHTLMHLRIHDCLVAYTAKYKSADEFLHFKIIARTWSRQGLGYVHWSLGEGLDVSLATATSKELQRAEEQSALPPALLEAATHKRLDGLYDGIQARLTGSYLGFKKGWIAPVVKLGRVNKHPTPFTASKCHSFHPFPPLFLKVASFPAVKESRV